MMDSQYNFMYTASGDSDSKKIYITWTIKDFKRMLGDKEIKIQTQAEEYGKDIDENLIFKLMMLSNGNDDMLEISYCAPVRMYVKVVVSNMWKGSRHITLAVWSNRAAAGQWQTLAEILKADAFYLMYTDCLTLEFQFDVYRILPEDDFTKVPDTQLNDDFEKLLENSTASDVTLKSVEGVEFPAHKSILIARSAVFKSHFEHDTKYCLTNIVESPFEPVVIQELLHYIYTGKTCKLDKIPMKMLTAACYYQLKGLKTLCEKSLYENLSVDNAIETLQLADLQSADILKRLTIEYINNGRAEQVIKTKGWKTMQSVDLVKRIFEYNYE